MLRFCHATSALIFCYFNVIGNITVGKPTKVIKFYELEGTEISSVKRFTNCLGQSKFEKENSCLWPLWNILYFCFGPKIWPLCGGCRGGGVIQINYLGYPEAEQRFLTLYYVWK